MKNETEIDDAIGSLIKKVSSVKNEDEALKYTQAVVNLSNAKRTLKDSEDKQ